MYTFSTKLNATAVAGSWNNWKAVQMVATGGLATVSLSIPSGKTTYKFMDGNGEWFVDPALPTISEGMHENNYVELFGKYPLPQLM